MSLAFIGQYLCCCFSRDRSEDVIDENSHLITPRVESSSPVVVFVDHERMKERLGTIVRAKEGKMVNVNSHIPFNLHNQAISPGLKRSSSRSTTVSTSRHVSHESALPQPSNHRQSAYSNVLTNPAHSSPSPGPSRHLSRSSSPFVGENDTLVPPRNPILNVRLVGAHRTGRARERAGNDASREPATTGLGLDLDLGVADPDIAKDPDDATPRPHGPNEPDTDRKKKTAESSSPILEGLTFPDLGAISVSWGD